MVFLLGLFPSDAVIDDPTQLFGMIPRVLGCTGNTGDTKVAASTFPIVERAKHLAPGVGTPDADCPPAFLGVA
jgi:hypothetical protein